jgi:hypothetical protein
LGNGVVNPLGGGEEGGGRCTYIVQQLAEQKSFSLNCLQLVKKIISMSQNFRETQFFLFFAKRFRFVCGVK